MRPKTPEEFLHLLFLIKLYSAETASTIVFVVWIARSVWREFRPKPTSASVETPLAPSAPPPRPNPSRCCIAKTPSQSGGR